MLGLRSALTWLLPELPNWLAAEIARAEHCRRQLQSKEIPLGPTSLTPPSSTSTPADQRISTSLGMNIGDTTTTTNEQSLDSQHSEELFELKDVHPTRETYNLVNEGQTVLKRESSPDSQPSQVIEHNIYIKLHKAFILNIIK